jgi:hypothetical protein
MWGKRSKADMHVERSWEDPSPTWNRILTIMGQRMQLELRQKGQDTVQSHLIEQIHTQSRLSQIETRRFFLKPTALTTDSGKREHDGGK